MFDSTHEDGSLADRCRQRVRHGILNPMPARDYNRYMREYMARRYEERKKRALALLGNRCIQCGSSEDLQFDHREREGKSFTLCRYLAGCSEVRFLEELAKCQLLCERCHTDKTIKEVGRSPARGTHGTESSYRYCKCDLCKQAIRDAQRRRRAKSKVILGS